MRQRLCPKLQTFRQHRRGRGVTAVRGAVVKSSLYYGAYIDRTKYSLLFFPALSLAHIRPREDKRGGVTRHDSEEKVKKEKNGIN